jgi:hypothetical protein
MMRQKYVFLLRDMVLMQNVPNIVGRKVKLRDLVKTKDAFAAPVYMDKTTAMKITTEDFHHYFSEYRKNRIWIVLMHVN